MKLSNIFKKSTKTVAKANVEKLEKNQLEKVIGGADTIGGALPGGSVISSANNKVNQGLQAAGSAVAQGAS